MNSIGLRISLYIVIAVCPDIIVWLNNSFDFTVRGVLIISFLYLKNAALTVRTYLDQSKMRLDAENTPAPVVTPPPPAPITP